MWFIKIVKLESVQMCLETDETMDSGTVSVTISTNMYHNNPLLAEDFFA